MSKTYNNIPMSKKEAERVARQDEAFTGPKFIGLIAVTLIFALSVLYAAAWHHIGPTIHQ